MPIALACYCGSYRQTARVVTQLYDAALKPSGLKITQFGILGVLSQHPGLTTSALAAALGMDGTTLTRTLKIISDHAWIRARAGVDKRARYWTLTDSGRERLDCALPYWRGAQKELAQRAQDIDLRELNKTMFRLTELAGQ